MKEEHPFPQNTTKDTKPVDGNTRVANTDTDMADPVSPKTSVCPPDWDALGTFIQALRATSFDQAQALLNRSFQLRLTLDASIKDVVGYDSGLDAFLPREILNIASYAGLTEIGDVHSHGGSSSATAEEYDHSRQSNEWRND